ncbi:transporter [Legionella antarctica]|uniref:Transporter n=1 Tax=Legionella antarctica TaxID=2708020 RepID=A0A6F8T893_9GAMM|nr:AEC family transporter [Legionella antarctica]BCA96186.1 transporter [Legionella antarctica]
MITDQIVPIIVIIVLGIWIEKNKLLGSEGYRVINTFAYYIGMPLLLISSIATNPIILQDYRSYSLAFVCSMLILFIGLFCYFIIKDNKIQLAALKGLGSTFPNSGFIGIPVLTALFGQAGLTTAAFSTLLTLVPFSIAIIVLEINKCGFRMAFIDAFRSIIKNPLLLATVTGLLISHYHLALPPIMLTTFQILGNSAIPLALLGVGQMLVVFKINKLSEIYSLALIKLFVHPLVAFCFFYWFHVNPPLMVMGVIIASLPTAVMQSVLAYQYNAYEAESSGLVLLTTVLSFITLPLTIYLINRIGFVV